MTYLSDAQIDEMAQAVVTAIDVAAITHTRKCEVAREYAQDTFGVTPRQSAVLLAVKLANVAWHGASMAARQNAPIYSSDPREEELMIEQNARDDYYAELAAEHHDPHAHLDDYLDAVQEQIDQAPTVKKTYSNKYAQVDAMTNGSFNLYNSVTGEYKGNVLTWAEAKGFMHDQRNYYSAMEA